MRISLWPSLIRIIADFVCIWGGINAAYWLRFSSAHAWFGLPPALESFPGFPVATLFVAVGIIAWCTLASVYRGPFVSFASEVSRLLRSLIGAFGALVLIFFLGRVYFFSRFVFLAAFGLVLTLLIVNRAVIRLGTRLAAKQGYGRRIRVVYAQGETGTRVMNTLEVIDQEEVHTLVQLQDLEAVLAKIHPHEVLIACDSLQDVDIPSLARLCHRYHTALRYVPDETALDLSHVSVGTLVGMPVLTLHYTNMYGSWVGVKWLFDRCASALGLVALSPVLLWVHWRVKREYPSVSSLYASQRVGENGQLFTCYKFRSMVPEAEAMKAELMQHNEREDDVLFKMEDDPRVTPFGRFLRRTSLDELPQLWNVLRGDMSLVGPRAHLPEEVEKYAFDDLRILGTKPGLTGYAQVNGRSKNSFREEMRYELTYVQNWSFWMDISILWRTVGMVFRQENVS